MMETIHEQLLTHFNQSAGIKDKVDQNKKAVQKSEISPFAAAWQVLDLYFKSLDKN